MPRNPPDASPTTLEAVALSPVALMAPALMARPFHHEGWVYEEKVSMGTLWWPRRTGALLDLRVVVALTSPAALPGIISAPPQLRPLTCPTPHS